MSLLASSCRRGALAGGRPRAADVRSHRQPHTNSRRRRGSHVVPAASSNGGDDGDGPSTSGSSSTGIPAGLLLFVSSAAFTLTSLRNELGDALSEDDGGLSELTLAGLGLGDVAGAVLWAIALWYASPLQLLLVFLGRFESERPSDLIIGALGRAAGLPVDQPDYVAPAWARAAAALACVGGGVLTAALLEWSLGDPTWSISTGLGALFAAAIFEAGRPRRLSAQEAQLLEEQWQAFAAFADAKLQRSGRCHESEVFAAFRRASPGRFRSPDTLPDSTLRDMVRNWGGPALERTRTGYLRGMSLQRPPAPAPAAPAGLDAAVPAAPPSSSPLLDSIAEAAAAEARRPADVPAAGDAETAASRRL